MDTNAGKKVRVGRQGRIVIPAPLREAMGLGPGEELLGRVEDVSAAFSRATDAGATAAAGPKTKPWGQTVAYVRDPDGVLVEIGDEVAG